MNEFEWLHQLRTLRQPITPRRDLWASIDAALEGNDEHAGATSVTAPSRWHRHRWLLAASFAGVLLLAGSLGLRQQIFSKAGSESSLAKLPSTPWKPSDPRLRGAAVELDTARMELQQAMQQSPGSEALHRLLARTEQQQAQLRQLAHEAG